MRFAARLVVIVATLLTAPFVGAALGGRGGATAGAAIALLAVLHMWLWLPRIAHGAFEAGRWNVAARRYRWLQRLAVTAARERAALLSRAGCSVSVKDVDEAEALLASFDGGSLAVAERAVWLNNRACAQLVAERDAHAALALADEAGALRPDVPALQHTRAMALIAVGRTDDAIAVLESMRSGGELPPRLESDRCRELARAWTQKGEAAYADDYRMRAASFSR